MRGCTTVCSTPAREKLETKETSMARPLTIIAITGISISAAAFIAAGSVAANSITSFFPWTDILGWKNSGRCVNEMGASGDDPATREFAWLGGDEVGLSVPGTLRYRPGPGNTVVAHGPAWLLGHLEIDDDSIRYECSPRDAARLEIVMEADGVNEFAIFGLGEIVLEDLTEPVVEIAIAGTGSVTATGNVERLELSIAGTGDADLGGLAAREVEVSIAGTGDAVVSPSERLDVNIAGAGDVELLTDPPEVNSNIFGSGRVTRR
jgi:hypothetical protein